LNPDELLLECTRRSSSMSRSIIGVQVLTPPVLPPPPPPWRCRCCG
jgi:hypothetical protein